MPTLEAGYLLLLPSQIEPGYTQTHTHTHMSLSIYIRLHSSLSTLVQALVKVCIRARSLPADTTLAFLGPRPDPRDRIRNRQPETHRGGLERQCPALSSKQITTNSSQHKPRTQTHLVHLHFHLPGTKMPHATLRTRLHHAGRTPAVGPFITSDQQQQQQQQEIKSPNKHVTALAKIARALHTLAA